MALAIIVVRRFRKDVSPRQPRALTVSRRVGDAYLNNRRMVRHHTALGDSLVQAGQAPESIRHHKQRRRLHVEALPAHSLRARTTTAVPMRLGSRRGKRRRAQVGEVSVLSNAPYGYRYIRKTDEAPAAYLIDEAEARVVRSVYEMYTVEGLSIGEIARRLNRERIPTRKASRWERSVIWALLRNPAYRGLACFGKTRASARTRVMRPQRRRGATTACTTAGHERPREEWIEIPVPALVTEESFARAQELLHQNKIRSRRRTIAPSVVQGLVSCAKCGYAFPEHPPKPAHVRSTTTNALGPIVGVSSEARFATMAASSDKNSLIRSSGMR